MKITYWSDYACPYCYIAKTRLKKALERVAPQESVELEMKSFELYPDAPQKVTTTTLARFARKYGLSMEQAEQRVDGISALGRAEGIDFKYATTLNTNMLDAHRLTKLAHSLGNTALEEILFRAYFVDNRVLADHATLRELAAEAGLPAQDVDRVLDSDEFTREVRSDEDQAAALGVHAVPFFVVDGTYAIEGCRPTSQMVAVLQEAMAIAAKNAENDPHGMACGPDQCAI